MDREGVKGAVRGEVIHFDLKGKTNLATSTIKPFKSFQSLQARYPSGKTIHGVASASEVPSFVVRALLSSSNGDIYFYVGPEGELEAAQSQVERAVFHRD